MVLFEGASIIIQARKLDAHIVEIQDRRNGPGYRETVLRN